MHSSHHGSSIQLADISTFKIFLKEKKIIKKIEACLQLGHRKQLP